MSPGGAVIVEGTSIDRVARDVAEVRERLGITSPIERIDWNSMTWRVHEIDVQRARSDTDADAPTARRVAPVPPTPQDAVDLSVVVVFYNMRREAARTLLSLTRSYQRGIEDLDYEVIVVDNGSAPDQRLGEEYVAGFGPEFRYVDLGDDAPPSPTIALNRGVGRGTGREPSRS